MADSFFKDQVAVVTGASKGLGKAISSTLAERGISIVLADIDRDEGKTHQGIIQRRMTIE